MPMTIGKKMQYILYDIYFTNTQLVYISGILVCTSYLWKFLYKTMVCDNPIVTTVIGDGLKITQVLL